MIIPIGNRCCSKHLTDSGLLLENDLENLMIWRKNTILNQIDIETFFSTFRTNNWKNQNLFAKFGDFENLDSELCIKISNLYKDEFFFLCNELVTLKNSPQRTKEQALAVYLFWLKTGLSQETISILFGIKNRTSIQKYCCQVREAISRDFIDQYLGAKAKNREEWLSNNTEMVKTLHDLNEDQLALIADGTYLYCEKSANNFIQRKLYSGQKKRPLIKPFVICTTNGHIVDVYGPYAAVDNDAKIMEDILNKNEDLKNIICPNDLLILDRGFRDVIETLENKYLFKTLMPSCSSEQQLTTLQANYTRLVTKIRWVIEAINGLFKNEFKALEQCKNTMLPHIFKDFRIAAAIINCFFLQVSF